MPWCTTSLTKNESIGGGGRLKSEFSRLSVRDPKNKEEREDTPFDRWEVTFYTQKQSRGIRHVLSCCLSPKVLILEKKEASKIKISE